MRLVHHRNDVAAVVQDAAGLGELEDRGDDDLARVLRQQALQLGPTVGLHEIWRIRGVEGARDLAVEVDPVHHDHHCGILQGRMEPQLPRCEEHQEGLAGSLEVPDEPLLRVAGDDALDDLVRGLVLLMAGDDLDTALLLVRGVRGEAGQEVQDDVRPQHRIDGLFDALQRRRFAVCLDPPGSPQVHRQTDGAIAELLALGGDRDDVRDEQLGDVAFVVVVDLNRRVEPALARPDGRLRLDHDERNAVDQQHEISALLAGTSAARELRGDDVLVAFEVVEVHEPDGDVLAALAERHRPLADEPSGELLVRLDEAVAPDAHEDGAQPVQHIVRAVGLSGDLRVEPNQRLAQVILDQDFMRLASKVLRREEVPAEAGDATLPARETWTDGGVVRDAAAQAVADKGFDGVGLR